LLALAGVAHAATVQYVYDELGRLSAEIDPAGDTTIYTYDAAGNLLSVSRAASTQFQIIGFAPTRGTVGDTVTIFGTGFIANPAQNFVSFNGTPAASTAATTTSLVVTVPAGVTTGPIAVSNANGSGATTQPFVVLFPPVITAVDPGAVSRGATTRVTITGSQLSSATDVRFDQAGMTVRLIPGASDTELTVDLTVAGTVPVGSYPFSVTNNAGSTQSGSVTVTVTTALVGEVSSLSRPLSVHLPAVVPGAPSGNAMSVAARGISVHLPAVIPGVPAGNAMSVTANPVSVHLPATIPGAPPGNAMTVTANPISVHLPAVIPGAPPGNAMSVTQPVSVSMP
jgi:YD repeat-containing protein